MLLLIAAVFMLSNSICCAQDITEYLDGRAVNVIETDDEINIYMLISMTGDASMYMLPHTAVTYEKAFYRGVEQMWEGSYMASNKGRIDALRSLTYGCNSSYSKRKTGIYTQPKYRKRCIVQCYGQEKYKINHNNSACYGITGIIWVLIAE